ncbi:MAG: 8-oxoguanine DNA glycosylase [Clostridiales Family XIII bacterium]|jgi:N-glycosylase/DNA lyase|nr:8-oxoguanine DNA glycosylase [Clostridiales Family XIII bacterium]
MANDLGKLIFNNVSDFNLDDTFDCGQCFRWNRESDGSWSGIVAGAFANISFAPTRGENTGSVVIWSNLHAGDPARREAYWRDYLDLGRDYGAIKRILGTEDPVMQKAIKAGPGIRILNQNKWETLISFLISQNNNIPRIRGCIESLCRAHGRRIGKLKGSSVFSFPTIERLAALEDSDLDMCRLGYRARYIAETAKQVARDGGARLEAGEDVPTAEIESYLESLTGVGPKVANCIMLFSMKKTEVFPIDVWVRRVMNRFYGMGEENVSAIKDYAERNFGEYGGIAQQYLFNYIRTIKDDNPALYERFGFESGSMDETAVVFAEE